MRRVLQSISTGESRSLSRGADAGQPSGVGEIPLPLLNRLFLLLLLSTYANTSRSYVELPLVIGA